MQIVTAGNLNHGVNFQPKVRVPHAASHHSQNSHNFTIFSAAFGGGREAGKPLGKPPGKPPQRLFGKPAADAPDPALERATASGSRSPRREVRSPTRRREGREPAAGGREPAAQGDDVPRRIRNWGGGTRRTKGAQCDWYRRFVCGSTQARAGVLFAR